EGIDELDGGELAAAEEGAGLGDAEVGKVNGLWHRILLPLQGSRQDGADRIGRAVGRPHMFPGPGEYTRIPPLSSALDRSAYFYAAMLRKAWRDGYGTSRITH